MGVAKFYSWIRNRNYRGVLKRSVPSYVSSFSLDLNSILHTVAQTVYAYGSGENEQRQKLIAKADPKMLEAEYYQALATKLSEVISQVRPRDVLVLAVDGVAPQAKIAQQRQRRYRASMESTGTPGSFSSNAITPGTEFMIRVDNFLQRWILSVRDTLPTKVIYSPHTVVAEGEHMILSLMRKGEISNSTEGAHVIYGMDADLIMLSLMAPLNHIHLMREDISNVVDIDELRVSLREELKSVTAVEDFVIMTFMIGNDFLPHMVALSDLDESIETMMRIYKMTGVSLSKDKDIDWPNMAKFLAAMSLEEDRLLEMESQREVKHPSVMMDKATEKISVLSSGKFAISVKNTNKFNPEIFRGAWYENAFNLRTKSNVFQKLLPATNLGVTREKIADMTHAYLTGVAWVFRYYIMGMEYVNNDYVYRYHYAPLLRELAFMANQNKRKVELSSYDFNPNALIINPVHQLLAVLPLKSKDLLPSEVLHLTHSDSLIADLFPVDIQIDKGGMNTDWQGVVLVNFVDMSRIINAVEKTTLFTSERMDTFANRENVVLIKDATVTALDEKNRKLRQYLSSQSGGRGFQGRGRGFQAQKQEGGNREGNQGRGYRGNIEGRGYQGNKPQGRGYNQDNKSQGRGFSGGRGRGRGAYTNKNSPPKFVQPVQPQMPIQPQIPTQVYPKALPVQRFEL